MSVDKQRLLGQAEHGHALLAVTMDFYANQIMGFIKEGITTHRSLIAAMMEARLVFGPDEGSAVLDLLVATRRLHKAESALANQASGLYLPY
jgi:hypothetical protein